MERTKRVLDKSFFRGLRECSAIMKSNARTCPKCGSTNSVGHSDSKLRQEHKMVRQCFDCNNFWKIDLEEELDQAGDKIDQN